MDQKETRGLEARDGSPAMGERTWEPERRRRPDRRQAERRTSERRRGQAPAAAARPYGRLRRLRSRGGLLLELKDRVGEDHVVIVAAGVAFSLFLSVFPTLFALVSLYGLVADARTIDSHRAWLSGLLPREALQLVRGQLHAIAATPRTALQWGTAVSILLALWSAASGSAALIEGLNIARDADERRGFLRLRGTALAFSLGFVLFLIASVTLIAGVPNVLARLPLPEAARAASQVAQWVVLVALILVVLGIVYRYGPARPAALRRLVTPGALVGALLWLQISCLVVLVGAELDAAFERRRGAALPPVRPA